MAFGEENKKIRADSPTRVAAETLARELPKKIS